ncbi:MAG: DUF1080 domain-containing protein [Tepidisphaeraceae bacterium]|jgi:hypothetical protein
MLAFVLAAGISGADEPKTDAIFNGKDLAGLKPCVKDQKNNWVVVSSVKLDPAAETKLLGEGTGGQADSVLLNTANGADLASAKRYGDCEVHAEFMLARKSDSGLFLHGLYQLQICDSFGLPDNKMSEGECGGIMWTSKPRTNACLAPGQWQTIDIVFHAPRFDDKAKKTAKAKFVKVTLNGKVIQENVDVDEPTGGGLEEAESATGPLVIQGMEGTVAYRNVRVTQNLKN